MNSQGSGISQESRQWAMFLHLSQLINFVVPLGGVVAPIIIWQLKKAEFPDLDTHGKTVMNWLISAFIYSIGGLILAFIVIGIPLLMALALLGIGFPIYGAIKASEGTHWPYPLTIRFLK